MYSDVKASTKAFTRTEIFVTPSRIRNQAPISSARAASGLLNCDTKLMASTRISAIAVRRAKKGPRGNAATNMVTNPYCKTASRITCLY